jgi:demethylmenaquinone methyltransferase/2-methoxy-6-polyprenyl-1,4-benzoquinol methylase
VRTPLAAPPPSDRKAHALSLFAGLPRAYDRAGAVMSFGQDPRWRAALVAAAPVGPADRVLDVATGTGMVAGALVRRFDCRVVGLDQSAEMLAAARARLGDDPRVELRVGEAEHLPFADGSFDALTFTYLLRYVDDVPATLRELARVVRPGGFVGMVEFGVPRAAWARTLWRVWTRVGLPAVGRAISRDWLEVGRFLGPSIERYGAEWPLARLVEAWRAAGIGSVRVRPMSLGAGVVMTGVRGGVA